MDETQNRSFRQQVIALLKLKEDGDYSAADVLSDLGRLVERGGPKLMSVRIVHRVDPDPGLFWMGRYLNAVPSDLADWQVIDREAKGDCRHGEYRYFVGGDNYRGEPEAEARKYTLQDYERMEAYNRGDWTMLTIGAEADVQVETSVGLVMQIITSGGLSGVESDGGDAHRHEVADEQLAELQEILSALDVAAALPPLDEIEVVERH